MDAESIRQDFPLLSKRDPPIYFDNACTTLKPRSVIDAVTEYYEEAPVCGGRSIHRLAHRVTARVDESRARLAKFLGARSPDEIIFTKNASEAINIVALGLDLQEGDVVVTSDKEHNSNWLPWLRLRDKVRIRLLTVPSDKQGRTTVEQVVKVLRSAGDRLRLASFVHVSNADGVTVPVGRIAKLVHDHGGLMMADAAQSLPHRPVNVRSLGPDIVVGSAHKMLGPSGLGFLWAPPNVQGQLEPVLLGGGTVDTSTHDGYSLLAGPQRYEPGLLNYAAVWALPAALDYLDRLGRENIEAHETKLNTYATKRIGEASGVQTYGPAASERSGILPFNVGGITSHEVALYLDEARRIAIRSGAHCVNSYFARRDLEGWARASFYLYNTKDEVDAFADAVEELARGVQARRRRKAR